MSSDPSQNVHEQLLPHIHLINTYRYALMPRVEIAEVTKWLLGAPKIARDTAPFYWTYLDAPQDGTILLTWQPLQRLGIEMASDGYVWAGSETFYHSEVGNGLILELYYQRLGFRPGEQIATHCRRRFRLTPPKVMTTNTPQVDPSLWIVHYGPVENNERMPTAHIPFDPRTQAVLNARAQLQRAGQIARKEFILSDRVNWPQIPLPREPRGQPMYAGPAAGRPVPQQMAYPHITVTPASKRRHAPTAPPAQFQPMEAYDDEEDTTRGDYLDHLTPFKVSGERFKQNHEWMEELLSSPTRMGLITPADLGLGLMGELESITKGIFEPSGANAAHDAPKKPLVGRLEPDMAEEFRKRIAEKLEATTAELETMKSEHSKLLESFQANSVIKNAEKELRLDTSEGGQEIWHLEGQFEEGEEATDKWNLKQHKQADDIVANIESSVGRKAEVVHDVARIQDGGYQEPAPEPIPEPVPEVIPAEQAETLAAGAGESMSRQLSQNGSLASGAMLGDPDVEMGGTAAGLLDLHGGLSPASTPANNFSTPQPHLSAVASSVATPSHINVPSPQIIPPPIAEEDSMEGVTTGEQAAKEASAPAPATAPDQGTGSGDWVVVPKGGVSPEPPAAAASSSTAAATAAVPVTTEAATAETTTNASGPSVASKPVSAAPTPAVGDSESGAFDADNNDFSSLGDLDSAGDALAGYDPPNLDEAGDGLDLNMDMDDSAFGDAFHGVDASRDGEGIGTTPADGGM